MPIRQSAMGLSLVTLFSLSTFAAPMRQSTPVVKPIVRSSLYQEVKANLGHSPEKRSLAFRGMGKQVKPALSEIAFEKKEPLTTRWKALVTLGRLDPKYAEAELEKALKSPEWFMRNAALVVVPYGDRDWAIKKARVAIHDPALVVRTAAVKVLVDVRAREASPLLWEKINATENFRRGESLWIRPIISQALATMARKEDKDSFTKLLKDRDPRVQAQAKVALNKIANLN